MNPEMERGRGGGMRHALSRAVNSSVLLQFANPRMKRLVRSARGAAGSDATVLVSGERGVGKSVLAAAIHSWSGCMNLRFTALACASLDEDAFESGLLPQLDRSDGGTAVLEEIADLSPTIQTWLTSALKCRAERASASIDPLAGARIIATTSRDLEAQSLAGYFRSDLLHLVNIVSIRIPPLRERPEDLPLLAPWVLNSFAASLAARARAPAASARGARRLSLAWKSARARKRARSGGGSLPRRSHPSRRLARLRAESFHERRARGVLRKNAASALRRAAAHRERRRDLGDARNRGLAARNRRDDSLAKAQAVRDVNGVGKGTEMLDTIFVIIVVAFFAAAIVYVNACERL
jgi:sigma54-dependent transcription regulator